jgi:hypothetical protein
MSTYTPIVSQTLASAASSITFTSLPQNYTDLYIVVSGQLASGLTGLCCQYNGDTGTNYSYTRYYANDLNAVEGSRESNIAKNVFGFVSALDNTVTYSINNYSNSSTYKVGIGRSGINDYNSYVFIYANLWRNTSPITSIKIYTDSGGNFPIGTTFSLYGMSVGNALATKATGGNIIATDGSYWYHAFTSTGIFEPTQSLTADILVVAGGGGGGGYFGAGGGAGGLLTFTSQSLTAQSYTAVVGAGGSGMNNYYYTNPAMNGNYSQFGSLTQVVGGGGGAGGGGGSIAIGQVGGSGGGGGTSFAYPNAQLVGAAGTSGQGNSGGSANHAADASGAASAGGGGAGANGSAGTYPTSPGAGGIGYYDSLTDAMGAATKTGVLSSTHYYFAGGGGGGGGNSATIAAGGIGGGGSGGRDNTTTGGFITAGTAGVANTGGGAGGSRPGAGGNVGFAGGSGIIIVRYPV